jgi:uncharacterized protein (TIGR02246 family)
MTGETDIAEVLEADQRAVRATLAGDAEGFAAVLAPQCIVHGPDNRVRQAPDTIAAFQAGLISYIAFERNIERTARLGDLVVTMGEETIKPKGKAPHAGKTVRRRFTDVWGRVDGQWRIELRQATIIAIE